MKTSSAKGKGRRACKKAQEELLRVFPSLEPDDIRVTPSGVPGEDLQLSPAARRLFPYQVECKNVEKLNIWEAFEQAKTHGDYTPLLVYTRNRSDMMVTLRFEDFLKLFQGGNGGREEEDKAPLYKVREEDQSS